MHVLQSPCGVTTIGWVPGCCGVEPKLEQNCSQLRTPRIFLTPSIWIYSTLQLRPVLAAVYGPVHLCASSTTLLQSIIVPWGFRGETQEATVK